MPVESTAGVLNCGGSAGIIDDVSTDADSPNLIDDIDIFENIKAIQIIDIIACIQQTYALRTWSKDC